MRLSVFEGFEGADAVLYIDRRFPHSDGRPVIVDASLGAVAVQSEFVVKAEGPAREGDSVLPGHRFD